MRILMVCTILPQKRADWWRIYNISEIMKNNGHDVHFIHYCRESNYLKLKNKEKYSNHTFITFKSLIFSPIIIHLKHLRILNKKDYDIIYCNGPCSVFYTLFDRWNKVRKIFDMHGDIVEEFLIKKSKINLSSFFKLNFLKIIDFVSTRFTDDIICVSNKEIDVLTKKRGIPLDKLHYVTNGVDLKFFRPSPCEKDSKKREKLGINNKLVFGYIGSFQKWQGVENFIKTAKKIDKENIAFLFIGDDINIKKENIINIPWVSHDNIREYYSICDVLVLPRPKHNAAEVAAPTKFSEYVAMGKPILATNVGDAAFFVKKYNCGIVIEDNTPENFIIGIDQFLNLSKKELSKMGNNSRILAEKEFDWNKISLKLANLLKFQGN
jgi:glycosyltransferase involved in cell wall biosynthesis